MSRLAASQAQRDIKLQVQDDLRRQQEESARHYGYSEKSQKSIQPSPHNRKNSLEGKHKPKEHGKHGMSFSDWSHQEGAGHKRDLSDEEQRRAGGAHGERRGADGEVIRDNSSPKKNKKGKK